MFLMPKQGSVCVFAGQGSAGVSSPEPVCWTVLCSPRPGSAVSLAFLPVITQRPLSIIKIPAQLLILPCLFVKICAAGNDESQGPHLVIPRPCGQPVALCCWRPDAVQLSSFISVVRVYRPLLTQRMLFLASTTFCNHSAFNSSPFFCPPGDRYE